MRAIQAAPEPDGPRLVAADWLSERGDPRGEHVALQVELARTRAAPAPRLVARLAAIETAPWREPLAALGARADADGGELELVRGFVDRAFLADRDIANVAPLLRREPITRLDVTGSTEHAATLAARAPELGRLRELYLHGRYSPGHGALLRSPYLAELDTLYADELLEAQLAVLAESVLRPRVLHLSPRPAVARTLAASRLFERVEELQCGVMFDDDALVEIAHAPLAALRRLVIGGSQLGPRGLQALGPRLAQLEVLRHPGRLLDGAALALIAREATGLVELELPGAVVPPDHPLRGRFPRLG